MAYQRRDPLPAYNFQVTLLDSSSDGSGAGFGNVTLSTSGLKTVAGFSEVSGLEVSMDVEDYSPGGTNDAVLKFAGRMQWSNLVLKRGLVARRDPMDKSDLWSWFQSFLDGQGVRKDGVIALQNEAHQPKLVWGWRRGLPLRWRGPGLNAVQSAAAVESIEIAHEGLYQIKGGGEVGEAIRGVVDAIF